MENPLLTIIFATLNNPEGLHKAILSLYKNSPENLFRIIVIDNSNGEQVLPETLPLIHVYVKSYRNLGFAKSFNTGLMMSTTPYIGMFNDDIEAIDPGWWDGVIETFQVPSIGAVNAMSPRNPYHTGDIISQYPYQTEWTPEDVQRIKRVFGDNGNVDGICTWCTVFKRTILEEVGRKENSPVGLAKMDESFGYGSGEDYDFNRRFGIAGYRMVASKKVWFWHWWGRTKNNMPVEKNSQNSKNYDLIAGGYATLTNKWGPPRGTQPHETADGWDINGRSGPTFPLDRPFATIIDL